MGVYIYHPSICMAKSWLRVGKELDAEAIWFSDFHQTFIHKKLETKIKLYSWHGQQNVIHSMTFIMKYGK